MHRVPSQTCASVFTACESSVRACGSFLEPLLLCSAAIPFFVRALPLIERSLPLGVPEPRQPKDRVVLEFVPRHAAPPPAPPNSARDGRFDLDDDDMSRVETSSAAIGAFYPPVEPLSPRERTPRLLTSRMPLSWALSPEFETNTRGAIMREVQQMGSPEGSPRMMAIAGEREARGIMVSSQRDAARGFALTLATLASQMPPPSESREALTPRAQGKPHDMGSLRPYRSTHTHTHLSPRFERRAPPAAPPPWHASPAKSALTLHSPRTFDEYHMFKHPQVRYTRLPSGSAALSAGAVVPGGVAGSLLDDPMGSGLLHGHRAKARWDVQPPANDLTPRQRDRSFALPHPRG